MKKVLSVIGLVVLTAGTSFAQGYHDMGRGYHGGYESRGYGSCYGYGRGGHMSSYGKGFASEGRHGWKGSRHWDEAGMRDAMKSRGMSEADITKAVQIQKEQREVMNRTREASFRQMMKERGVSEADINKMIQLQAESEALWDKYNAAGLDRE